MTMKKQCEVCGTYRHQSTMLLSSIHNSWFCSNECLDQYRRYVNGVWQRVVIDNPNMR